MEDFVTYEIAKKLREKGFKGKCVAHYYHSRSKLVFNQTVFRGAIVEDCLYSYNSLPIECIGSNLIDAPTISQVLNWLRKEKSIFVSPCLYKKGYEPYIQSTIFKDGEDYTDMWRVNKFYSSYEGAALKGIEYVLNNLL